MDIQSSSNTGHRASAPFVTPYKADTFSMAFCFGKGACYGKTNQAIVRLSAERIQALKVLLKNKTGHAPSDEDAQQIGLTIVRFVLAKEIAKHNRNNLTINGEFKNEIEQNDKKRL